ncbi:uncharacterized protein LOC119836179 [Zerene cesonia]|uniref:uncharacterized protein LOC119836179 n=1 Tax=Zerene cesonia TaxID=33412 RepID=UPI0018E56D83|nr:uncharacterized protein LOC119836179 [Zerene cesonia]
MSNRVSLERSLRRALRVSSALGAAPVRCRGERVRPSRAFICYGKLFLAVLSVWFAYEVYTIGWKVAHASEPTPVLYQQSGRLAYMLLDLLTLAVAALRGPLRARLIVQILREVELLNKTEMETCLLDRMLQLIVPAIVPCVWFLATSHYCLIRAWTLSIYLLAFALRAASCLLILQFVLLALLINCVLLDTNKRLEQLAGFSAPEAAAISYKCLATPRYVVPVKYINISVDAIGSLSKISNGESERMF